MDNNLKVGIISGFIAGIIGILVYEISSNAAISMGLCEPWWEPIWTGNILVNIPLAGFWGVILGIIYSRVYNIIPKKGIWKSLIYSLFLWIIVPIRIQTYFIPYGAILIAVGDIFATLFSWIAIGLVLGFLYEFLSGRYYPIKEKLKIKTYNMSSGILPGAIAGLCGGITAGIVAVMGHVTGYWGVITAGEVVSTIDFWMSQAGTHALLNMIWGTIFGTFFPKVYNLVPGKKVIKGFCYGLIMFFMTTFYCTTYALLWYANHSLWDLFLLEFLGISIGLSQAIVYGLVLGLLYRKPPK